jgi:transcriptional regulator with GAF, ATPase, and Fis domain
MQVEDDRANGVQLHGLIARLSSVLSRPLDRDLSAHLEETLREIVTILDADRSTLVEFSRDTSTIETVHTWARPGIPIFRPSVDRRQIEWLLVRCRAGEAADVAGQGDLPPDVAVDREHGGRPPLVSALVVPINISDRPRCALSVDSFRHRRDWAAPTLAILRFIGETLAAALDHHRQELDLESMSADLARASQEVENGHAYVCERIESSHGVNEIAGGNAAFRDAFNQVREVAPTDATVLLRGETGTGKELFARATHYYSTRRQRLMVRVNCGALPAALIESELFGHERGAFTGAVTARQGRFELAHQGTIFLDEIGDLPLELQPRLLRVLQEGEFERIGSSRTRHVDVRVIAATHRDLGAAVEDGSFRADLYYRISVFPIALPPLRERRDDIPGLVWFFIHKHKRALGRNIDDVPTSVMQALQSYEWPGNVRELENIIGRAMIRSTDNVLMLDQRLDGESEHGGETEGPSDEMRTLAQVERRHMEGVLRECGWRINGPNNAAERLQLHPNTLRFRLKKLGIQRPSHVVV